MKPVLAAVVSSIWSGQRGEFTVLHHPDGCVQLHYARAAGGPGRWGCSSDCVALLAQRALAKVNGSRACPDTCSAPGQWVEPVSSAEKWRSDEWFIDALDGENAKRLHLNLAGDFLNVSQKAQYVHGLLIPFHQHFFLLTLPAFLGVFRTFN